MLIASAAGHGHGYSSRIPVASAETRTGCVVKLNQDTEIAGRVINLDKDPVEGVTIELTHRIHARGKRGSTRSVTVAATTTGLDGRFRIEHCSSEEVFVSASKTGYEDAYIREIPTDKPLTIVLIPGPTVNALVTEAATGKPVPEATVYYLTDWGSEENETDERGRCTITSASPGHRRFFATAPSLASPEPVMAELVRGKTTEITLPLVPRQPIEGVVTDAATGKPIEDADLALCKPGARGESRRYKGGFDDGPESLLDEADIFTASTDEQGVFEIKASVPQLTVLVVEADGYLDETVDLEGRDLSSPLAIQLKQGAVLAGRVITSEGLPIADAEVECTREETGKFDNDYDSHSTETDEDGCFRFGGLGRGEYTLEADHDEFISTRKDPIELAENQVIDTVDIVLNRGGRISGTVIGPTGEPVPEATVTFFPKPEGTDEEREEPYARYHRSYDSASTAQTDADGHYKSDPLTPGTYRLNAYANLLICLDPQELTVAEGTVLDEITFVLEPGSGLSGTVLDESGAPVPGAHVVGESRETWNENHAGVQEDGTFTVTGFAAGDKVYLRARAEGYARYGESHTAPAHDIRITLDPALMLTGRVVDKKTQEPVELFSITEGEWVGRFESYREGDIEHHPDGRFTVELASMFGPDDDSAIQIVAEGYAPGVVKDVEVEEGQEPAELLIELVEGTTLMLTTIANGQPVADAEVESARDDSFSGLTGGDGRCLIEHLAPGKHKFTVEHSDFAAQTVQVKINEGETQREVTVALDPGGTVHGRVVAKLTGQPVAGASIIMWGRGTEEWALGDADFADAVTRSDPNGTFEITCVPPGRYVLGVQHDDYAPFLEKRRIGKGEGEPLLIELSAGGRIVGTVTDANGVPQHEATVVAVSSLRQLFGEEEGWVETDEQGRYAIDLLPPGDYRVAAALVDDEMFFGGKIEWQRVVVRDGQETQANFVIGGGAAVFGQVTRGGQPLTHWMVILVPKNASIEVFMGSSLRGSLDESGQYRIEGVKPGTYKFMIWAGRSQRVLREFVMGATDLHLDIQLGAFSIAGAVYNNASQPLANAEVSLISEPKGDGDLSGYLSLWSLFAGTISTGETGEFSVDCDQPGTYRLYVSADGYASRIIPIEQPAHQQVPPLRIQLDKACTIRGTLKTADDPPDEILVFVLDQEGRLLTGEDAAVDPETGEWELEKLGPGRYTILAKVMGYAVASQPISVTRGQDTTVNLELDEGHDLTVAVRDTAGRPVPGARITVELGDDPLVASIVSVMSMFEQQMGHVPTPGTEGSVVVSHLPKGDCSLRVQADGYEPATTKVRVTGDSGNVTVTLKPAKPTGR